MWNIRFRKQKIKKKKKSNRLSLTFKYFDEFHNIYERVLPDIADEVDSFKIIIIIIILIAECKYINSR